MAPRHRLALASGRAREEHHYWCDSACTTRNLRRLTVKCLFVPVGEEVIGSVRHELSLTHSAGGSGGRSSVGVKALDVSSCGQ